MFYLCISIETGTLVKLVILHLNIIVCILIELFSDELQFVTVVATITFILFSKKKIINNTNIYYLFFILNVLQKITAKTIYIGRLCLQTPGQHIKQRT